MLLLLVFFRIPRIFFRRMVSRDKSVKKWALAERKFRLLTCCLIGPCSIIVQCVSAHVDLCQQPWHIDTYNSCMTQYLATMIPLCLLYIPIDVYFLKVVQTDYFERFPEDISEKNSTNRKVIQIAEREDFDGI